MRHFSTGAYVVRIDTTLSDRGYANPPDIRVEGPDPTNFGGDYEYVFDPATFSNEGIWAVKQYGDTPLWSYMVGHPQDQLERHRSFHGALGTDLLRNAWSSRAQAINEVGWWPVLHDVTVSAVGGRGGYAMAVEVAWLVDQMPSGWWLEEAKFGLVAVSKNYPNKRDS